MDIAILMNPLASTYPGETYFNAAHDTQLERAIVDAIEAAHARRTR